jgi:hypothetical protein
MLRKIIAASNTEKKGAITNVSSFGLVYGINNKHTNGPVVESVQDSARAAQSLRIQANAGTSVLVSGVPNREIAVTNYVMIASSATPISFLSASTLISGPMSVSASGGISANSDEFLFKTSAGQSLSVATSGSLNGHLTYRLI